MEHDDHRVGSLVFPAALAAAGYNAGGLYQTVVADGKPVLCARCHASEALGAAGFAGVPALTRSLHMRHATVMDDGTGMPLDSVDDRSACYTCHPGGAGGLGPALNNKALPASAIRLQVRHGFGVMPAFSEQQISQDQLDALIAFLKALRREH